MKRLMLVIGLAVTASAILIPSLAQAADPPKKLDVMLYVDTVNGSRPVGAKPRPVSCTQTAATASTATALVNRCFRKMTPFVDVHSCDRWTGPLDSDPEVGSSVLVVGPFHMSVMVNSGRRSRIGESPRWIAGNYPLRTRFSRRDV